MTSALIWAALLGLTLGAGLLLILVTQPVGWRPSLEQRVEPQLRHHIPASRLLEEERAGASPGGAGGRSPAPPPHICNWSCSPRTQQKSQCPRLFCWASTQVGRN